MTGLAARLRLATTVAAAALLTAVFACTPKEKAPDDSAGAAASVMKVALVTSGSVSDQGWNGSAYDGLKGLHDSLGAQISNIVAKSPAEYEENFRQYGAQKYTIVFGHGFEFQGAAKLVAPEFPNTNYVIVSGRETDSNISGVGFAFEQASYQAGVLAGAMTKSNILGMIAGAEIPPVKTSFAAFERGAKSVNPKVRVLTSYIGNWDDASAGKELALTQIGQGADLIFQNANAAGLGVFQAVKEKKILGIGANANQNDIVPDLIVASVVIDLPKAMLLIAREINAGNFKGHVFDLGVQKDVVRLEINPAFTARIPAKTITAIDSIGALLKAGTFHTLDDLLAGTDSAIKARP